MDFTPPPNAGLNHPPVWSRRNRSALRSRWSLLLVVTLSVTLGVLAGAALTIKFDQYFAAGDTSAPTTVVDGPPVIPASPSPAIKTTVARRLGLAAMPDGDQAWVNGLKMAFNPDGSGGLISASLLRNCDFDAFVKETGFRTSGWTWVHYNTGWERRPGYDWHYGQDLSSTATVTTLEPGEAAAFCDWLTRREQEQGWLKPGQVYHAYVEMPAVPRGPHSYRIALDLHS